MPVAFLLTPHRRLVTGNPGPNGEVIVHVFGRTDVGRTREHNEDTFAVADLTSFNASLQPEVRTHTLGERGSLFMVCDGMGGAAAGEVASAMAVDVILGELDKRWRNAAGKDAETFAHALKGATEVANERIHTFAGSRPEHRGMGTTATIAGFLGDTLYLSQVGDSRGYIVRDGEAVQITKDQSLMQKLIEAGEMTPEEAEVSERRNIILQALGPEPKIKVDLTTQRVMRGDVLVLCSDGLSGQVRAHEIAEIVKTEPDLVQVCKKLIDRANEAGGPDNITVVAVRFEGEGLATSDGQTLEYRPYRGPQDGRATVPVDRSSVPGLSALDDDEPITEPITEPILPPGAQDQSEIPTLETDAITPEKIIVGTAKAAGPTARIAPEDRDALRRRVEGGRVPKDLLRAVFGAIAVLVAAIYLYRWIRG